MLLHKDRQAVAQSLVVYKGFISPNEQLTGELKVVLHIPCLMVQSSCSVLFATLFYYLGYCGILNNLENYLIAMLLLPLKTLQLLTPPTAAKLINMKHHLLMTCREH